MQSSDLRDRIGALPPEKRALLLKRLSEEAGRSQARAEATLASKIERRPDPAIAPLSFAQQRFWFLEHMRTGAPLLNMPGVVYIEGSLDVSALHRSLNEIVVRHEALRTTFQVRDGELVQVIAPELTIDLPVVDLSGLSEQERSAEVRRMAGEAARCQFDLAAGPTMRVSLLRLSDLSHACLFVMHHIVSDGWSMGVFRSELAQLYNAYSSGEPSPLPQVSIHYPDYAAWQRRWFADIQGDEGVQTQAHLQYWIDQLAGAPDLELPTDYGRPAVLSARGTREGFRLSPHVTEALRELSRKQQVTLFMTLLAAFDVLLLRYSGQPDISVGTVLANRNRPELEPIIGLFLNTVVLRVDLSGDPTFLELLQRVRDVVVAAYAHQDVPFEVLLDRLHPNRDPSRTPLFQALFILQNFPVETPDLSGLELSGMAVDNETAKLELMLSMGDRQGVLAGGLEYSTDLYSADRIERMIGHFQTLLSSIVSDPSQRLSQLQMLTDPERRQILIEWSHGEARTPSGLTVQEMFEHQAELRPDAPAVQHRQASLTYAELNARADSLAAILQERGVGRETVVGLLLPRSLDLIVALLGVLKAGGAYLPLDPQYPVARLTTMLTDSRCHLLITNSDLADRLFDDEGSAELDSGLQIIRMDSEAEEIAHRRAGNPPSSAAPTDLAYVIYTSGSTGAPKGVQIEHRSLSNYVSAAADAFSLSADDRIVQFASISFDTAAEEIFPILARGGTLVLRTDDMLTSSSTFLRACGELGISVLDLPTVYWHHLVHDMEAGGLQLPDSLRLVIIGGERALPQHLKRWQQVVGDRVRLLNTYGPTEATIVATMWELSSEWQADAGAMEVPIGRPVANAQVYVLDRHCRPVPVGVPGELYIGGVGLARGYLGLPDLTSEAFIEDPFGDGSVSRLYRTGDLARFLPDGNLEFLGRTDQQVKVRGYRVELGEIEAALSSHAGITEAVVLLEGEQQQGGRLVAYVVPKPAHAPSSSDLKIWLSQSLPDYMAPSAVVILDAFPRTPGGKVDRQALPSPQHERSDLTGIYVAPRTPTEESIALIWCEILDLGRVGVTDNFFDLGGHSLLAVQVIARVHAEMGVEIPLGRLMESSTVSGLASLVDGLLDLGSDVDASHAATATALPSVVVPIQPYGSRLPAFCIHSTSGAVFPYYVLARHLGDDQPLYGIQDASLAEERAPYSSIEDMASHYVKAIRTVQPQGPYQLLGWSLGGLIAFEIAQQLQDSGHQVGFLGLIDTGALPPGSVGRSPTKWRLTNLPSLVPIWSALVRDSLDYARNGLLLVAASLLRDSVERQSPTLIARLKRWMGDRARAYVAKRLPIPPDVSVESQRMLIGLPQARQFFELVPVHTRVGAAYVPRPYRGKVTLFRAGQTANVGRESRDPTLGWADIAAEGVDVFDIPGNHSEVLREPVAGVLAELLSKCLHRADAQVNNDTG